MRAYLVRRLLLMAVTLVGIMLVAFATIQFAPGGPVEQVIARLQGNAVSATARVGGDQGEFRSMSSTPASKYRGAQGLDPEFIRQLEKQFGFDKPWYVRLSSMMWNFARFDFGESYFRHERVSALIAEKLPVSLSLGLWSTLIIYLVSIPLGIRKAVRDGSAFDVWSSVVIVVAYAIPGFLFAIILVVLFAGSSYFHWFPLRGIVSDDWSDLSLAGKVGDYFWHLVLPLTAYTIGGFATMALLTKNAFLNEIHKQYVTTARAKGLGETGALYRHVFRNAMLVVVAGFPQAFFEIFIAGSLLIETIFSLDGMGLLSYESIINRDYPVVFGMLYIFSLAGLVITLLGDVAYMLIDPRIDFETREL